MHFGTEKVVRAVSRMLYSKRNTAHSMRDTARRDERDTPITNSATIKLVSTSVTGKIRSLGYLNA